MSMEHPRHLNRPHLVRVAGIALPGGTNIQWTPPNLQHVELISLRVELDTDANAANRRMSLVIGTIGTDEIKVTCPVVQLLNTVYSYWFIRGLGYNQAAIYDNMWQGGLPLGALFQAPWNMRTEIDNFLAGDQILNYQIYYQMWQDPVAP